MKMSFRSGSALLIVLGMLSFMVVSAIGFSVFMRQNRIPSSFVRRNTTSHQLLKAALARAMNDLDSAIGEDPFPGVDVDNRAKFLRGTPGKYIDDTWKGRVFVGSYHSSPTTVNTASDQVLISDEDTVSTLTMEGLAYLPPCLVNDVRYFSRHAPTAAWQMLAYDAGRYAYTAVNVSDYFDINKVPFAEPRTYSPSNRVSLAYMFRSGNGAPDANKAGEFHKKYVVPNQPFVSLADFNLVMFNQIGGIPQQANYGFVSPFGSYASGNGVFERYYSGADTNMIARTTFVTDSYFPETEVDEELLDLNDEACQPFDLVDDDSSTQDKNISQVYDEAKNSALATTLKANKKLNLTLSAPTWANLYDYLDKDSIPVSLAIPSVEQVPVVAGFTVSGLKDVEVNIDRSVLESDGFDPLKTPNEKGKYDANVEQKFVVKYTLNLASIKELNFKVKTLYPFKNIPEDSNFKIGVAAHIFWAPEGVEIRNKNPSNPSSKKSNDDSIVCGLFTEKGATEVGDNDNRFVYKITETDVNLPRNINTPEDAIVEVNDIKLSPSDSKTNVDVLHPILSVNESWVFEASDSKHPEKGNWSRKSVEADKLSEIFRLMTPEHQLCSFANNNSSPLGKTFMPYVAFRIVIKDKGGNVVDLAPACGWDDANIFGTISAMATKYVDRNRSAFIIPATGASFKCNPEDLEKLSIASDRMSFSLNDVSYVCKDPKWNHNIYNWTKVDSPNMIEKTITDFFEARQYAGMDSDFFQSVSDMGWLQSISELSLLPRTTKFIRQGNVEKGTLKEGAWDEEENFGKSLPLTKNIASARGENVYLCEAEEEDDECFESMFADGSGGFRINPYSDDANIFLAAIAYTPYNWNAASPDNEWNYNTAIKKTFSDQADVPSARLSWKEIQDVAAKMQEKFESSDDWINAYNELGWGFTTGNDIFQDTDLSSADKKFLYGFWKGCFANRQQLFILFLRAEPTVSGGGAAAGQGGRAVAVVWRDPNPPKKPNGDYYADNDQSAPPHKMRVLFYKPLE